MQQNRYLILLGLGMVLALAGCQTYDASTQTRQQGWKQGQLQGPLDAAAKHYNDNKDTKDTIITALELGAIQRTAALADHQPVTNPGQAAAAMGPTPGATEKPLTQKELWYQASLSSFEAARDKALKYDQAAKVQAGQEAGALLTNLANLPYKGKGHDRIMAETYAGLNYLALGDTDKARVELNRVLQAQRTAVEDNSKRIEEAQQEAEASAKQSRAGNPNEGYDANRALQDPRLAGQLAGIEQEANTLTSNAYANYVNPFSVFLDGLFFATHAEGNSDLERSRKSFERVAGMIDNEYTRADLAMASDAANGKVPENLTYVIFETGTAAHLQEVRFDIPLFIVGQNKVPYVGAAFPRLAPDSNFTPYLDVSAGGTAYRTLLVGDMDAAVAQSFKNDWPGIVTKTLISTGIKATIQYIANQKAQKEGGTAGLLIGLGLGLFNYATTTADTRCWTTLPKQFQYCRFATPADKTLLINNPGGTPTSVSLPEGKVNLVYVKNIAPGLPNYIEKITLVP